jgi:small subunit ribosomal protein S6
MYLYESCLILSAQVPESELDPLLEKLQKPLIDGGAKIERTCRWGRRRLAQPINKQADGFYVVLFYDLPDPGDAITIFERNCRYEDNVLRVATIKVPRKIHGEEIQPIYPEPGFMADFNMAPRPRHARRREGEAFDRGPRRDFRPREDAPPPAEAGDAGVAVEGAVEAGGEGET